MKKLSRRTFVSNSIGAAAALSLPVTFPAKTNVHPIPMVTKDKGPDIIDSNLHLFEWPFRKLKYAEPKSLIKKLHHHRITEAWTGSYEALFHKDIHGVNTRLTEACRNHGEGMLLPFGTVNLAWPDWEEDLRRCDEVHKMRGIRIYPIYQTFDLDHKAFPELVRQVTARGMILQVVGDMEDIRHHHPIVLTRSMNAAALFDIMKQVPEAKIQLVYWNHRVGSDTLEKLIKETSVMIDTSRIEGVGEVGRLIEGNPWYGNTSPIAVERFLFGSHAPYFPVETNVIKLFESPLTLEQMQAIMSGNARRFMGSV